jgi:hypothetical protein
MGEFPIAALAARRQRLAFGSDHEASLAGEATPGHNEFRSASRLVELLNQSTLLHISKQVSSAIHIEIEQPAKGLVRHISVLGYLR